MPSTRTNAAAPWAALLLLLAPALAAGAGPLDIVTRPAAEAAAPAKAATPPGPEPFPVPAVVPAAVEAYRVLAEIRAKVATESALDEVLAPLDDAADVVERAGTEFARQPAATRSDRDLADFRQEMLRQDAILERWSRKVEDGVKVAWGYQRQLERMAEVWRLTEEQATAESAAPAIVDRARAVRGEIGELLKKVKVRLGRLLAAQDRVASLRIRILEWIAAADRADAERERQLFEIESKPIWKAFARRDPSRGGFGEQLGRVFHHNVSSLVAFVEEEGPSFLWVLVIFVVVVAAVTWAGRRFARRAAEDPGLAAPAEVLSHPVAAGLLIALSLTTWLLPRAPAAFSELAILLMLPPLLVMARNLLAPELRAPLFRLTALFAVMRFGALLPDSSLPGRLLVLAVGVLGLVGALGFLRRNAPWTRAVPHAGRRAFARLAIGALAALLAASVAANVVGNVSLARRLAEGSLSTAMIALLLAAVAGLVLALLAGSLRMPEIRRIPSVAEAHDAILERGTRLVGWGALLLWLAGTFRVFRVDAVVREALVATFTYRLRFGGIDVSLGDLAAFAVALWLSILLARLLRVVLEARLDRDARLPAGVPIAIAKTVSYVVVGLGFLVAVLASGMDVTRFTVILGTLSVGIGFGLQNVVNNFVSGLILLYERPIRVGDVIDVGTTMGTVSHIGIRSSTVKTFQGAEVVVPNSLLVSNQLTNWTLSDQVRRVEIDVGVAYGSDPTRVQEILLGSLSGIADVLAEPAPHVLFTGFGDSALGFQLRFWTARFDRYLGIASEVRTAVVQRLGEAGIEIPFPQRDLHVRSVDDAAARALRGVPPAGK